MTVSSWCTSTSRCDPGRSTCRTCRRRCSSPRPRPSRRRPSTPRISALLPEAPFAEASLADPGAFVAPARVTRRVDDEQHRVDSGAADRWCPLYGTSRYSLPSTHAVAGCALAHVELHEAVRATVPCPPPADHCSSIDPPDGTCGSCRSAGRSTSAPAGERRPPSRRPHRAHAGRSSSSSSSRCLSRRRC